MKRGVRRDLIHREQPDQAAFVVGPALAGIVAALAGPGWVIAFDAASFAALALLAVGLPVLAVRPAAPTTDEPPTPEAGGGWRTIVGQPALLGLLATTCAFFFPYGPVEVALPIYVAHDLDGSPALLGAYWTAFGLGAKFFLNKPFQPEQLLDAVEKVFV